MLLTKSKKDVMFVKRDPLIGIVGVWDDDLVCSVYSVRRSILFRLLVRDEAVPLDCEAVAMVACRPLVE